MDSIKTPPPYRGTPLLLISGLTYNLLMALCFCNPLELCTELNLLILSHEQDLIFFNSAFYITCFHDKFLYD